MTVNVYFFGHYSDFYPDRPLAITLEEGATIKDLALTLAAIDARLSNIAFHCRFAIDTEYAVLDQTLEQNTSVAVLPPMSGG